MSKQSNHFSKGCLITLIIVCAIPVVLFVLGVLNWHSENEVLEKLAKQEAAQELVLLKDVLPEYEIEEVRTITFPDNAYSVTLRFIRPIENNDIKALKKKHRLENLGNGKYRCGLLVVEVGSDIGMIEDIISSE